MSQERDPHAGSVFREGQLAKGEGKSPELGLEIGVGSHPANGAPGEEEVLRFGGSKLKHFQEVSTLCVTCG